MAHIKNNVVTDGLSGMLGGTLVFRNMNGKTFISKKPNKPSRESAQQHVNRNKFKEATEYAKTCMLDADKKAFYQARAKKLKLPNAYTAAITDYMRSVDVLTLNTSKAITERKIKIGVYKKGFVVNKLAVSIKDANGIILETQYAENKGNNDFVYRTELVWQDGYCIAVSERSVNEALSENSQEIKTPQRQ